MTGEIIFDNGKTASINGMVVREEVYGTFLNLHCTIAPSLLMEEQRERIRAQKTKDPLPKAGATVLTGRCKPLPSHRPKGICRYKETDK